VSNSGCPTDALALGNGHVVEREIGTIEQNQRAAEFPGRRDALAQAGTGVLLGEGQGRTRLGRSHLRVAGTLPPWPTITPYTLIWSSTSWSPENNERFLVEFSGGSIECFRPIFLTKDVKLAPRFKPDSNTLPARNFFSIWPQRTFLGDELPYRWAIAFDAGHHFIHWTNAGNP